MYRTHTIYVLGLLLILMIVPGIYFEISSPPVSGIDLGKKFLPITWNHLGGTDELGRDVYSRALQGTSLSLRISLIAWLASLFLGLVLGSLAAYYHNSLADTFISSLITYAYATPFIILLVALMGLMGSGIVNAYIILTVFAWAPVARHTRAVGIGLRSTQMIVASKSFGYGAVEMIFFVFIPQVFKPVLISSLSTLPEIIALDAGISFFGLGVQPPTPSLGKMIADGINFISPAWWMAFIPVMMLIIVCLIIRFFSISISDKIRYNA